MVLDFIVLPPLSVRMAGVFMCLYYVKFPVTSIMSAM